jgi:type VI secretion system secreted protein VgrG
MFRYAQDERWLRIDTPLGDGVLLVAAIKGREALSSLFHFTLDLLSETDDIDPAAIVGANVTISVRNLDDSLRYFNGFVRQFSSCGTDDRLSRYRAEIVPWTWFLTRSADCRIFQDRSVPEIIEQVFGDLGFSAYETSEIRGSHPRREYCVQYRETAFDFVSRLMEEEGIFYYFRHEDGQHVMVLADHAGAWMDAADREVRMLSRPGNEQLGDEITAWEHRHEYRSGKWAHTDYDFTAPSTDLAAAAGTVARLKDAGRFELFDYPGRYRARADGDALARLRMEEQEVPLHTVAGGGRCRSFTAGARFRLAGHPARHEAGRSYAIVSVEHAASQRGAFTTGGGDAEDVYSNTFTCIPDDVPFRPARTTPRPMVRGAQTAIVVGPPGEEIYTDAFGRVKVHFHWDRAGKRDENSSCWIRVAQPWAGNRWGVLFLPRIGQEVVVEFLEGDPDRPLVTGSVYNAEQMPPYELPEHKTRSALKTLSSQGGEGWNEIRFEDRKGEEQIFLHAERDQDSRTRHDSREWVGNERHLVVGDGKEGTGNQTELVRGNKSLTVRKDHVEKIEGDMSLTIGHGDGGGGNVSIVIEQDREELIEKNSRVHVKADRMEQVDGMQGLVVKGDDVRQVGGNAAITAGGVIQLSCRQLVISASAGMSIKGPGGFIDVGAGGVTIQGTVVKINSGGSAGDGITPPRLAAQDDRPPAVPAAAVDAADDRPGLVSAPEASPGPATSADSSLRAAASPAPAPVPVVAARRAAARGAAAPRGTAAAPAAVMTATLAPPPTAAEVELARSGAVTAGAAAARRKVATHFMMDGMGAEPSRVEAYLSGIDVNKPVEVVQFPPPARMGQWVRRGERPGLWFDPEGGQSPDRLGISPAGREYKVFAAPAGEGLRSTAAPFVDRRADPAHPVACRGGGTQMLVSGSTRDGFREAGS